DLEVQPWRGHILTREKHDANGSGLEPGDQLSRPIHTLFNIWRHPGFHALQYPLDPDFEGLRGQAASTFRPAEEYFHKQLRKRRVTARPILCWGFTSLIRLSPDVSVTRYHLE